MLLVELTRQLLHLEKMGRIQVRKDLSEAFAALYLELGDADHIWLAGQCLEDVDCIAAQMCQVAHAQELASELDVVNQLPLVVRLLALEALERKSHLCKLALENILKEYCNALGGGLLVDYEFLDIIAEPRLENTQLTDKCLVGATYEQNRVLWVPLAV